MPLAEVTGPGCVGHDCNPRASAGVILAAKRRSGNRSKSDIYTRALTSQRRCHDEEMSELMTLAVIDIDKTF